MKKYVRRYIFGILATTQFQGLFKIFYRLSLWSMNIGLGGDVEDSGEKYILTKLSKDIPSNTTAVVFDVGANQGQFSQALLKMFDKNIIIHSFEPSPNTFSILQNNLDGCTNISIHNFGLGEHDDEVTLYLDQEGSGEASLYQRQVSEKEWTITETVKLKTLDAFCIKNDVEHIHYLKLDVEGHELSVFKGAKKMLASGAIDRIQFEFGGCNIDSRTYFRDFFELLSPQYHLYRLVRNGLVPINHYHETLEIFTTTNFIAISKSLS
ncbi:MAG: FkbM family methyltransferase [Cyanobacteria bacterium J06633_8]